MRFMTLVKGPQAGPPPQALIDAIGKLGEEATRAGVMVETGGLHPGGAWLRITGDKIVVTDGPFSETKELIGGYAVYEVKSTAEAVEWSRRFLELHIEHYPGWAGEVEVRQVMGPNEVPS